MGFSRRTVLKASAAATVALSGVGAPFVARAQKAEFSYKFANNLPESHPLNVRAKEMSAAIKTETDGRVDVQIFSSNQLGSDTDSLSQIRSGGVEFFTMSGLILSGLVPAASINGIGFAFPDYATVWKAMDGELGNYVRGQIAKGDADALHLICDGRPDGGEKAFALHLAQFARCALGDEHADAASHQHKALVLKALIGFGNSERIGALLRGEGAHGGEHFAIGIGAIEDGPCNDIAQAQIDRAAVISHAASVP